MESFLQSQKLSIAKAIKKTFSSYLTFKDDLPTMLMNHLGKMFKVD